jgi:C-terminal processing protease CtpA/Prc
VKKLDFKVVPSAWARAGIKVGDRVTRINGEVIEGLGFKAFSKIVQKALEGPTAIFEVRSGDSDAVRRIEIRIRHGEDGEFMIVL